MAKHLNTYWDQQIVDLLEFGFPLDFNRNVRLQSTDDNHKSAIQFKEFTFFVLCIQQKSIQ